MGRLDGKVAVITGGAGGIGSAAARTMSAEGARVVVCGRRAEGAEAVAAEIRDGGGEALAVAADVSSPEDWQRVRAQTLEAFGGVDVLYNNAALLSEQALTEDLDVVATDLGIWRDQLEVNLLGSVLGCKTLIPAMLERGGGSIVNMSSSAGLRGFANICAYSSSKAGIEALTRSVATAYGKRGLRCNCIAPGTIKTAPNDTLWAQPGAMERMEAAHLTPYLGEPEHVAAVAAFLASDEAAFVTGVVLPVDGGFTAHEPSFGHG